MEDPNPLQPRGREAGGPERRRSARFDCDFRLEMLRGSEVFSLQITNLSKFGMFVQTGDPLWVRAEFQARLLTESPILLDCVVRRVEPGRGMGIEFCDLSPSARSSLDELLWKLAGRSGKE